MLITKSRLQGSSVVITLPSDNGKKTSENQEYIVVSSEFNRKTRFVAICSIISTIKKLPTRYILPEDLDTNGQVLISQLKSLDYKEN